MWPFRKRETRGEDAIRRPAGLPFRRGRAAVNADPGDVPPESALLTGELMRRIRRIEIRTRHLVDDSFAGEYHAIFKGRGMAFDEVRPYQPGDEVRSIDWNVTARTGEPHIKRYVEERELTVMLVVDASGSFDFGGTDRFKRDLAAELAAVLAFAATTNNDRVGLLVFTDRVERLIPPRKGRRHVLRLVRELLTFTPEGRGTSPAVALDTVARVLRRRAIVFVISDFLTDPEALRSSLAAVNRRHDVIAVALADPLERSIPPVGLLHLVDAETGGDLWVDTGDPAWRQRMEEHTAFRAAATRRAFNAAGVDVIDVSTDADYAGALTRFFERRARRLAR